MTEGEESNQQQQQQQQEVSSRILSLPVQN
jgi:hypothetical protein